MIRDTTAMDHTVSGSPLAKRRTLVLGVLFVLLALGTVLFLPSIRRWAQSEASIPISRVRIGEVTRGDLVREVTVEGRLVAAFHPTLFSPARGIVTLLVSEGEVVEQGQPLASVLSPELHNLLEQERASLNALSSSTERLQLESRQRQLESQQQVELGEVQVAAARRGLDRAQQLFDLGLLNEIELEAARDQVTVRNLELEQARRRLDMGAEILTFSLEDAQQQRDRQRLVVEDLDRQVGALVVRAPVSGLVSRRHVEESAAVEEGSALVTVVDLSAFEVEISVPESYASEIAADTRTEVTYGGRPYPGRVLAIAPEVHDSRVKGTVAISGPMPAGLRQNQRVTVRVLFETRPDVVKAPRGPFLESGGGRMAYVIDNGMAVLRPIEVGSVSVNEVEIVAGLEPGEQIILSDTARFDGVERVLLR